MINLETYLFTDQPTTCPKCGTRTQFIDLFTPLNTQVHKCPSPLCNFEFIQEEDFEE